MHAHDGKTNIMYNFYRELLGTSRPVLWAFNLSTLYPFLAVDGSTLSAPFSSSEIVEALFSMDRNSNPGLGGFGPSFYRAFWPALALRWSNSVLISTTAPHTWMVLIERFLS